MSEKIRYYSNGVAVIKSASYKKTPLDCPICKSALGSREDVSNYDTHGCCSECDLIWRYPNKEKWQEGWRPTEKDISNRIFIINHQEKKDV